MKIPFLPVQGISLMCLKTASFFHTRENLLEESSPLSRRKTEQEPAFQPVHLRNDININMVRVVPEYPIFALRARPKKLHSHPIQDETK